MSKQDSLFILLIVSSGILAISTGAISILVWFAGIVIGLIVGTVMTIIKDNR